MELDVIQVASPCSVPWDEMKGDDRVRFCRHCQLNVFNLSALPRDEAEALIAKREGRMCVRFYRRADGTVLTRDCPLGFCRAIRRQSRSARCWRRHRPRCWSRLWVVHFLPRTSKAPTHSRKWAASFTGNVQGSLIRGKSLGS